MGVRPCGPEQPAAETPGALQGPWQHCGGDTARFVLDLPQPTRRTDPPERRKKDALTALTLFPDPDCTIWSTIRLHHHHLAISATGSHTWPGYKRQLV